MSTSEVKVEVHDVHAMFIITSSKIIRCLLDTSTQVSESYTKCIT